MIVTRLPLAAFMLMAMLAGFASSGDVMAARPQIEDRDIEVAGETRHYLLFDARRSAAPAPLVIALHGGGGHAGNMADLWMEKAREAGFVAAFPEGTGRLKHMETWNAGECCGYAMSHDAKDVRFIAAMIDALEKTGRIDPDRIYVAGLSNGGMMTHRVAIALGDRLAAAGIVAGAMFGGEARPRAPLPVLIMHGKKDGTVPYDGGDSPRRIVARNQTAPFKPVRYAVNFWRHADGCDGKPVRETTGDVTVERHLHCRRGTEVVFLSLASADHTWPGAPEETLRRRSQAYDAIDATDALWDFFQDHRRH